MQSAKWFSAILVLAFVFVMIPVTGQATNLMQTKTVMTFNRPIELPGIALAPGSYVFRTSDSGLVQVFDAKEKKVYGAFLTVPAYRLDPPDKTSVVFEERQAGSPQALKSWTDAGEVTGHEFVYSSESH